MNATNVISYLGVLGIGSLIGIAVKAILDQKQEKRRLLFEARVKAYAGISGRLTNLFLEPDIASLPEALRFARINSLFSEVYMLGSASLHKELGEFTKKLNQFHNALESKDKKATSKLHPELVGMVAKLHNEMRKDLFLPKLPSKSDDKL